MWIETSEGAVNLEYAERIKVVDEMNIHVFRPGGEYLAAIQFPSADEAEKSYNEILEKLGVRSKPITGESFRAAIDRRKTR